MSYFGDLGVASVKAGTVTQKYYISITTIGSITLMQLLSSIKSVQLTLIISQVLQNIYSYRAWGLLLIMTVYLDTSVICIP